MSASRALVFLSLSGKLENAKLASPRGCCMARPRTSNRNLTFYCAEARGQAMTAMCIPIPIYTATKGRQYLRNCRFLEKLSSWRYLCISLSRLFSLLITKLCETENIVYVYKFFYVLYRILISFILQISIAV